MLISLSALCKKYPIKSEGVLHIGAHVGEERKDYESCGFNKVIWIEANPELARSLSASLESFERVFDTETVLNTAISEVENETTRFFVTNNLQSSSLREFGSHELFYPDFEVNKTITVLTRRIDRIFDESPELAEGLSFANLDIQGMELEALRGFGKYIDQFEWIYTEVNRNEVYRGGALVWDIDLYLLRHGFVRVETKWTPSEWGDAFYKRCRLSMPSKSIEVLRLQVVKNGYGLFNELKRFKRGLKLRLRGQ